MNWDEFERYLLAICVWRESRGEGYHCQCAVAHVIQNRVREQSWYGKSISEVIAKPWQFSSMSAPGDRQLVKWPERDDPSFKRSMEVVEDVMQGAPDTSNGSTHFHDCSIEPPAWTRDMEVKARLGRMVFYGKP